MHKLRRSTRHACPTCGADEFEECHTSWDRTENHEASVTPAEEREYAALRVLFAVKELKEVDPKHPFVTIFEAAGGFRGSEELEASKEVPALLRKQAD